MTRLITLTFFSLLLIAPVCIFAQTSEQRFTAGLSVIGIDYNKAINGSLSSYQNLDYGIEVSAHAYLNKALNLSLSSAFIPNTTYPFQSDVLLSTSLIDVSAAVQLKSNGTIFKENAFFAPYIGTGIGLNTASNNQRFYLPATAGVRLRITKGFGLNFQGTYKVALQQDQLQHIAYSAGMVFSLPTQTKRKPTPQKPKEPEEGPLADNALMDRDGDGVPDSRDHCPDEKGLEMYLGCPPDETSGEEENDYVAPAENSTPVFTETSTEALEDYPPISKEDIAILERAMDNIYFKPASTEISSQSLRVLDQVAQLLEKYPNYGLQVLGHTDNTGSYNINQVLSVMRAFEVKNYLVYQKGIQMGRITSDGYSYAQPVEDNTTNTGRSKNRRVEFKLLTPSQMNQRLSQNRN